MDDKHAECGSKDAVIDILDRVQSAMHQSVASAGLSPSHTPGETSHSPGRTQNHTLGRVDSHTLESNESYIPLIVSSGARATEDGRCYGATTPSESSTSLEGEASTLTQDKQQGSPTTTTTTGGPFPTAPTTMLRGTTVSPASTTPSLHPVDGHEGLLAASHTHGMEAAHQEPQFQPEKIVLLIDRQDAYLKSFYYPKVFHIYDAKMNFGNAFDLIKKTNHVFNNTLFVMLCGTMSALRQEINDKCHLHLCKEPLYNYSMQEFKAPNLHEFLISEANNLRRNIMQMNNCDMIFSGALPVKIHCAEAFEAAKHYHQTGHQVKFSPTRYDFMYDDLCASLREFNKWAKADAASRGFPQWSLVDMLTKSDVTDSSHHFTHPTQADGVTLTGECIMARRQALIMKLKETFQKVAKNISQGPKLPLPPCNTNTKEKEKAAVEVPELSTSEPGVSSPPVKTMANSVVLLADHMYRNMLSTFQSQSGVTLITEKNLTPGSIGKIVQDYYTRESWDENTLWILCLGIFNFVNFTVNRSCVNNQCQEKLIDISFVKTKKQVLNKARDVMATINEFKNELKKALPGKTVMVAPLMQDAVLNSKPNQGERLFHHVVVLGNQMPPELEELCLKLSVHVVLQRITFDEAGKALIREYKQYWPRNTLWVILTDVLHLATPKLYSSCFKPDWIRTLGELLVYFANATMDEDAVFSDAGEDMMDTTESMALSIPTALVPTDYPLPFSQGNTTTTPSAQAQAVLDRQHEGPITRGRFQQQQNEGAVGMSAAQDQRHVVKKKQKTTNKKKAQNSPRENRDHRVEKGQGSLRAQKRRNTSEREKCHQPFKKRKIQETPNTNKVQKTSGTDKGQEVIKTDKVQKTSGTDKGQEVIKTDKVQKTSRTDKGQEVIKTDKVQKTSRTDKGQEVIKTDKVQKTSGTDKGQEVIKTDKVQKTSGTDKGQEVIKTDKVQKTSGTDKGQEVIKTDKLQKTSGTDKGQESTKTNKVQKTSRTDKGQEVIKTDKLQKTFGTDKGQEPTNTDKVQKTSRTDKGQEVIKTDKVQKTSGTDKGQEVIKIDKVQKTSGTDKGQEVIKSNKVQKTSGTDKGQEVIKSNKVQKTSGTDKGQEVIKSNKVQKTAGTDKGQEVIKTDKVQKTSGTDKGQEVIKTDKLQKTSGTDKGQESTKTNKVQKTSGTDKGQEVIKTEKVQKTSGTDKGQEVIKIDKAQKTSGTDKGQEPTNTDKVQKTSGTDKGQEVIKTGKLQKTSGTDKGLEVIKTDKVQKTSGTDKGQEVIKSNKVQKTSGTDKGQEVIKSNKVQKTSGTDKGQEVIKSNKVQKTAGTDKGQEVIKTDKVQKTSGTDKGQEVIKTDKVQKTSGTDKGQEVIKTDKLQKTSGTDKGQESTKTNKVQKTSGTDKGQEVIKTEKVQKTSGTDKGQEVIKIDKAQKTSGTDKGQEPTNTDKVQKTSGTDKGQEVIKTGKLQKTSGTDKGLEVIKTDKVQKTSGTDKGQEVIKTEKIQKTFGTDKGQEVIKTDKVQKTSGTDKGQEVIKIDKVQKTSGTDKGQEPTNSDKVQKTSGTDKGQEVIKSNKVQKTPRTDKGQKPTNTDKVQKTYGTDKGQEVMKTDKVQKTSRTDKGQDLHGEKTGQATVKTKKGETPKQRKGQVISRQGKDEEILNPRKDQVITKIEEDQDILVQYKSQVTIKMEKYEEICMIEGDKVITKMDEGQHHPLTEKGQATVKMEKERDIVKTEEFQCVVKSEVFEDIGNSEEVPQLHLQVEEGEETSDAESYALWLALSDTDQDEDEVSNDEDVGLQDVGHLSVHQVDKPSTSSRQSVEPKVEEPLPKLANTTALAHAPGRGGPQSGDGKDAASYVMVQNVSKPEVDVSVLKQDMDEKTPKLSMEDNIPKQGMDDNEPLKDLGEDLSIHTYNSSDIEIISISSSIETIPLKDFEQDRAICNALHDCAFSKIEPGSDKDEEDFAEIQIIKELSVKLAALETPPAWSPGGAGGPATRKRKHSSPDRHSPISSCSSDSSCFDSDPETKKLFVMMQQNLNQSYQLNLQTFMQVPEAHPDFEARRTEFLKAYNKQHGGEVQDLDHCDADWIVFWEECAGKQLHDEWEKSKKDLVEQFRKISRKSTSNREDQPKRVKRHESGKESHPYQSHDTNAQSTPAVSQKLNMSMSSPLARNTRSKKISNHTPGLESCMSDMTNYSHLVSSISKATTTTDTKVKLQTSLLNLDKIMKDDNKARVRLMLSSFALLSELGRTLGALAPAVMAIMKCVLIEGVYSPGALHILARRDNVKVMKQCVDKLMLLSEKSRWANNEKLLRCITDTSELMQNVFSSLRSIRVVQNFNIPSIARATACQDTTSILQYIKSALASKGVPNPSKSFLNEVFLAVSSHHFNLAMQSPPAASPDPSK
ncbi:Paternally-expressed 3 protein [Chionoecetes opilio]|uniref:Paternally-expressed 3 protein n=1 Tax=Chionoecetes opilio TaxID=41210 RepID=A0A8J5D5J6_CHIOP|nr:Paternally-expressed 3 protein [Chionoecetes opilio]